MTRDKVEASGVLDFRDRNPWGSRGRVAASLSLSRYGSWLERPGGAAATQGKAAMKNVD